MKGAFSADEREVLAICQGLIERARSRGADEAEAVVSRTRGAETSVENGDVHTVQSSQETVFGLRVIAAGSLGFVTANDTSDQALDRATDEALEQARIVPADEWNGLPEANDVGVVEGLFDPAVAGLGVDETSRMAMAMLEKVRSIDERVRIDSGSVGVEVDVSAIASSRGIQLAESSTTVSGYLFGMAVDGDEVASFDYDGESTRKWDGAEGLLEKSAERFAKKCLAGLGAGQGESFRGTVLLSPEAMAEFLLPNLITAITADQVRKGRTPLAGCLGQNIACPQFTLTDDGSRPGGVASSAFDREGMAIKSTVLVDGGVLANFLYDHYEARAAGNGHASTGHARGSATSLPSIGSSMLEVAAGDTEEADLVGATEKAVIVNRFSGSTNPVTGDFSGVVKNGFLLHGSSRRPVREVMIAGNLFELIKNISAVSRQRRLVGSTHLLPTLRVENISVTAA